MSLPRVIRTVAEMQRMALEARANGVVGLVPTMGARHEGHLSLVRAAKQASDVVIVSLFVNPTQFAPGEDFQQYPRTFDTDLELLGKEGVQFVFAPSTEEMYPEGASTFVEVGGIGERLDGHFRPGHFRGVATVVAKLFHITLPHLAFFGQKDAAQVAVLKAMVRDLNFPLEIVVCPTVREADGLAMSSRNRYLSAEERQQALVLSRALRAAQDASSTGTSDAAELKRRMVECVADEPAAMLEYAEVVSADTLLPVEKAGNGTLLAIALRIGKTRLIDNLLLGEGSMTVSA